MAMEGVQGLCRGPEHPALSTTTYDNLRYSAEVMAAVPRLRRTGEVLPSAAIALKSQE
jgi:hypothetical protein